MDNRNYQNRLSISLNVKPMSCTPLVSITISTHNRSHYLRQSVESVLKQTFQDFEVILCDDASTDDTPQVCAELRHLDARIRTVRHQCNCGMVANWNSGLEASRGCYFTKLDDDNRYLPTFLEETVKALEECSVASFAFTDEWFIDSAGRHDFEKTEFSSHKYGRTGLASGLQADTALLAVNQSAGINATLFRAEAVKAVGGFRPFASAGADMDLFLNLAYNGHQGIYIPERLAEYRVHEGQTTMDLGVNIEKARSAVSIWRGFHFSDKAERLRVSKLVTAHSALSRVLMLNTDIAGARRSILDAWKLNPANPKTMAIMLILYMPGSVRERLIRSRYHL